MGRPRKYPDDAAKLRAYRERWAVKTFRMDKDLAATVEKLAEFTDESESTVIDSLVKFALLNRNWFTFGLFGKRLSKDNQARHIKKLESPEGDA